MVPIKVVDRVEQLTRGVAAHRRDAAVIPLVPPLAAHHRAFRATAAGAVGGVHGLALCWTALIRLQQGRRPRLRVVIIAWCAAILRQCERRDLGRRRTPTWLDAILQGKSRRLGCRIVLFHQHRILRRGCQRRDVSRCHSRLFARRCADEERPRGCCCLRGRLRWRLSRQGRGWPIGATRLLLRAWLPKWRFRLLGGGCECRRLLARAQGGRRGGRGACLRLARRRRTTHRGEPLGWLGDASHRHGESGDRCDEFARILRHPPHRLEPGGECRLLHEPALQPPRLDAALQLHRKIAKASHVGAVCRTEPTLLHHHEPLHPFAMLCWSSRHSSAVAIVAGVGGSSRASHTKSTTSSSGLRPGSSEEAPSGAEVKGPGLVPPTSAASGAAPASGGATASGGAAVCATVAAITSVAADDAAEVPATASAPTGSHALPAGLGRAADADVATPLARLAFLLGLAGCVASREGVESPPRDCGQLAPPRSRSRPLASTALGTECFLGFARAGLVPVCCLAGSVGAVIGRGAADTVVSATWIRGVVKARSNWTGWTRVLASRLSCFGLDAPEASALGEAPASSAGARLG
eukprot:scaffold12941_cov120-Isochrysis_galbana.AAC.2